MLPVQLSLAHVPCLHMGQSNLINTLSDGDDFLRSEWEKKATEVLFKCITE